MYCGGESYCDPYRGCVFDGDDPDYSPDDDYDDDDYDDDNGFDSVTTNMTEKDLQEAKERLIGLRKISSEESLNVMNELLFSEISTGDAESYYDYENKINAVSLQEVKELSKIDKYSTATIMPK